MIRRLVVLIQLIIVLSTSILFSKDLNNFPSLPSNAQLEAYTENEDLYNEKLFEYYNIALEYNALIKERELTPKIKLASPTSEEISSPDPNILKKYYKIAQELKNQFDAIPANNTISKLKRYKDAIDSLRYDNERLKSEIYDFSLNENNTQFYKKLADKLIEENSKEKFKEDSINLSRLERMKTNYDNLKKLYSDSYANSSIMFSISLAGNRVYFGSKSIKTDPGYNVGINLNAGPLLGFGKDLEIFGNYINFKIRETESNSNSEIEWNANMFQIGAQYIFKDVIRLSDFKTNLALGTGFFFGDGRTPNLNSNNISLKGNFFKFEVSFRNVNYNFPLELYMSYSANSHSSDLDFVVPSSRTTIINPTSEVLSIGARFNIWRSIDN